MNDFVGGALAARRLAMTYKAVEHIARTRPKDSPRNTRNTKVVVVMEKLSTDTPAPGPWPLPPAAQAWRDRHPKACRPIFSDAVQIAGAILDDGDLGPDSTSPTDCRAFFAPLVRIPDDLEHRFRANVNTDSGKLNSDSGQVEHGFRACEQRFRGS